MLSVSDSFVLTIVVLAGLSCGAIGCGEAVSTPSPKEAMAGTGVTPRNLNDGESRTEKTHPVNEDNGKVADNAPSSESEQAPSETDVKVTRQKKLLVGSWSRESYGSRTLTINADGSAQLVIKPNSFYSVVFGDKISAEIAWELQGEFVDYKVTSADPEEKFEIARKAWGDHWHEKILKLDDTKLILLGDNDKKYEWTRVKSESGESSG